MIAWNDELWEEVWERLLDPVERYDISLAVWRRRLPDQQLHRRIAPELARRWRRKALALATLYGLWALFWGSIAWSAHPEYEEATGLPLVAALLGCLAVTLCFAARRWVAPIARLAV